MKTSCTDDKNLLTLLRRLPEGYEVLWWVCLALNLCRQKKN